MFSRFFIITSLVVASFLTGCATRTPMAYSEEANKATPNNTPVYLMTVTFKNTYKTAYQPKLIVAHVEKNGAKESADRLNFMIDDKGKEESQNTATGNSYLLRMPLENGGYIIRGFSATARSFPVNGFYFAPLHAPLMATGNGIFYLGHVDATVRERQGNEFKAGASIPLIDQAAAGASGGSFDIVISDQWTIDEQKFKAKFPALKDATIQKSILPEFNRAAAQKWWESN